MDDVTVIGGGIVGAACARELALRGASVVVLERDRVGRACSHGNAGWLTPSLAVPLAAPGTLANAARWLLDPDSPFHVQPRADLGLLLWLARFVAASRRTRFERHAAALVALCRWSLDAWETLARESPVPFGFERRGLLAVHESPAGLAAGRAAADLVERFGIRHEVWSPADVRDREPAIVGPQVGAVFHPDDAHCEPAAAMAAMADAARRAGATFEEDVEVLDAERSGDRLTALSTTRGRREVRAVVLAAGAWSGVLARRLGVSLPMLGGKGYSLVLPRLDPHPTRSIYLAERKVAINPHADALRISGTLELVDRDLSVSPRRVEAIVRAARAMLPLPDAVDTRDPWTGLRPCTSDGMPRIGRAPGTSNLWLATGHQMTGLKTAPGTGRLLAELMAGGPVTVVDDPAAFAGGG